MTNLRQAAQQALEALIPLANAASPNERECLTDEDHERAAEALEALCAALAEPEQEPVAWVLVTPYGEEDDIFYTEPETVPDGWSYKPLYDTAPTPRKPLTDEEIDRVTDQQWAQNNHKPIYAAHRAYARAIERAHGIGGQHGS